jgi:hypothetical protein
MRYDATGVDASGGFPLIEKEGWYPFRIVVATEGKSKDNDYQVVVDAVCLDSRWKDYGIRHWVTFLPKSKPGAGMALHFLKCIGEPYEGVIDVNPMAWERKTFMGYAIVNKFTDKEGREKRNNKLDKISPIKDETGIEFGEPAPSQKTAFDE